MLLDANLLVYAVDEASPVHERAKAWLEATLNGQRRVGIAWPTLAAFLRLTTNPRAMSEPFQPHEAWEVVDQWFDAPTVWVVQPGRAHRQVFRQLVVDHDLRADLVPDAVLAALCVEYGLEMLSADTDFVRFREIRWRNPLV